MPGFSPRHYRFDWKLTLLALILLPVLLRLGFWQLEREDEKQALQSVYTQRQQEQPVPLAGLDGMGDLQYRAVRLSGRFDNEHVFLLDNRIHEGVPGYDVLQPFVTESGLWVLINRGWTAMSGSRADLPEVSAMEGNVTLSGNVYVPAGEQFTLGDTAPEPGWPKVVQELSPQQLLEAAGLESGAAYFPYSVRLAADSPGVLTRNWPVITTSPEKHRAYAVQWFAMALALVLLYIYYSCRDPHGREQDS